MSVTRDEEFRHYVLQRRLVLLRTATLLTGGDAHRAEDLVQTTLTRLYLAWPRVRAAENLHAYAHRALVNTLVDEERRPWRRHEQLSAQPPEYAGQPERIGSDTDGVPGTDDVHRALQHLPARMRAAVVLRYFHDLSVAETAQALNCTQGTVKSQTARALDKLRRQLGTDLDIDEACPRTTPTLIATSSRSYS
ncbi:MAG: SigE family RNA polymerase sigma factor [Janthinobacterium lividum]